MVELDNPSATAVDDVAPLARAAAQGAAVTPLGVGLVGCGTSAAVPARTRRGLTGCAFVACADVDPEAARATAREHGLRRARRTSCSPRDDVDVVLCLTPPDLHADVALQAIAAGKHVYTEKPLATSVDAAARCSTRPRRPACSSAARRTRSSAPASRRSSRARRRCDRDARARRRSACWPARRSAGTRRLPSCTPSSPARCSTSGPTRSRPPSSCSGPCAASPRSPRRPRETAGSTLDGHRLPDRRADPRRRRARARGRRPHHARRRRSTPTARRATASRSTAARARCSAAIPTRSTGP